MKLREEFTQWETSLKSSMALYLEEWTVLKVSAHLWPKSPLSHPWAPQGLLLGTPETLSLRCSRVYDEQSRYYGPSFLRLIKGLSGLKGRTDELSVWHSGSLTGKGLAQAYPGDSLLADNKTKPLSDPLAQRTLANVSWDLLWTESICRRQA